MGGGGGLDFSPPNIGFLCNAVPGPLKYHKTVKLEFNVRPCQINAIQMTFAGGLMMASLCYVYTMSPAATAVTISATVDETG